MRVSPLVVFGLGFVAGAAWWRGRSSPALRAPAPRPDRRAIDRAPAEGWSPAPHPGAERASVLGYERSAPATPDPAAGQPGGAPGHRILNG